MTNQVTAEVRYLDSRWKDRDDRPFIYSKQTRRENTIKRAVAITDARELQSNGDLDLDTSGFVLAGHDSAVNDFHDEAAVKASYETEIVPLLKRSRVPWRSRSSGIRSARKIQRLSWAPIRATCTAITR